MIKTYKIFFASLVLGLTVILFGFAFNVLFAGIPYQSDAPIQLKEQYDANTAIANGIYLAGLVIVIAGILIQAVVKWKKK